VARAENEALVRHIFAAFAQRRGFALRNVFAEDATWVVPGSGSMAGTFVGREQIFGFLGRLPKETGGTYSSSLIDVLASDDRAAALYRASGERNGRTLELDQVLLFRVENGLVQEVLALPSNPAEFDRFWG
jgi:ketosteroid isomerase-like protein